MPKKYRDDGIIRPTTSKNSREVSRDDVYVQIPLEVGQSSGISFAFDQVKNYH